MQRPLRYLLTATVFAVVTLWRSSNAQAALNAESAILNGIGELKDLTFGCASKQPYISASGAAAAQPRFRHVIANPLAEFIAVHFSQFNLPANDYVLITPAGQNNTETMSYKYRGDEHSGEFFSNALYTKSVVVELFTTGSDQAVNPFLCMGFTADNYRFLAQGSSYKGSAQEEVCGADDSREAACFKSSPLAFKRSDAVIRLLVHKGEGSFFCTGWLVGCEGHMVTNNHCIATQDHASNTEFEFRAQGDTCSMACNSALGCKGAVRARSSQLIISSVDLDYALVKLDINFSNDYGYLQMRETGAVLGERIYIAQHPAGWGKRISMKVDQDWGKVESLTMGGCLPDQVAYSLDTQGGSSGSPVIAWSDNAVVAIHHCGGCPNTAVNMNKIVADLRSKSLLPKCALYDGSGTTPAITVTDPPTAAPTPAPTAAPPPQQQEKRKTVVDGTISTTKSIVTVDYIEFTLATAADVELDILAMEAIKNGNSFNYVDVNNDCNAAYIDSSIVLFSVNADGSIAESTVIAVNDDAPVGYGLEDGSQSTSDSFILRPLAAGRYRVAVGVTSMTVAEALAKAMPTGKSPRVCNAAASNYGSYRLTIATTSGVTVTGPNSYIGSQCASGNSVQVFNQCPYHTEAPLTKSFSIDGTIVRQASSLSVDYIPFTVPSFGRVTMDLSSYESANENSFADVNGYCTSSYIDSAAFLFRVSGGALTAADLVNEVDDDDNYAKRKTRKAISFRDPFLSLALLPSHYVLVVGRYPMTIDDAINKVNTQSPDAFSPMSCGAKADKGNYMVTFNSAQDLVVVSPNSFTGSKCPDHVGKPLCA